MLRRSGVLNKHAGALLLFWLVYHVLLSSAAAVIHRDEANPQRPMFYIYDWMNQFNDVWPPPGAVLKKSGYNHDFYENGGAGKLLDPKCGLFQTWQFSLYKNVMSRLRVSEHRTR